MEYNYAKLTGVDLEELARDLLMKHFKVDRIESFKAGRDGGIDLRYTQLDQKTIVQCKHYIKSGLTKLKYDLEKIELPKVIKLNPDRYILFASVEMNPNDKKQIMNIFAPYIKAEEDIFSLNEIEGLLIKHDDVVRNTPKLWFSSTAILKEILYNQFNNCSLTKTHELIKKLENAIPRYVQTDSYKKALDVLLENKSIIISGNAGIGKTTLAEMLIYFLMKEGFTS